VAETKPYRLPSAVIPRKYALELVPDIANATFAGSVTVTADVLESTAEVVLNAAELDISAASIVHPDGKREAGSVVLSATEQQARITFPSEMAEGIGYLLELNFAGSLNDKLRGFYLSSFTDDDGVEHLIATTQFEPTDARRAFPCWDEPAFKARFSIGLVIDDGLTAISNAAEAGSEVLEGGRRRVWFEETMPMSTYLVAFVVGPFELTDPRIVDDVAVRVAAVSGRSHLTGFAVEAATHSLEFLAGYFGIPYPGGKLDHVAIPDFSSGAMENLGCVTYRESALLADADEASQLELQRIATVVAHETAHMWFGDLVTMRWWNGIWLNEAFATFMELLTTDDFNPDWQVWTSFGASKSAALSTDGLRATRPVEYEVGRPEEAEAMFDVLTYQKGGAVLRMLEQYLGAEVFRKGISQYLYTHAYGNTETEDLWSALEAVSGEPVGEIMDSWIEQGGYPIVRAELGGDPRQLVLSQSRFLYDGASTDDLWAVPVDVRASVGGTLKQKRLLLNERTETVDFDGPIDWAVVNDQTWGFYRVIYASGLWDRLRAAGVPKVLGPLERLAVVSDSWASVVAGISTLPEWVSVVEALGIEEDPDVWSAIASVFNLLGLIADDTDKGALEGLVRRAARESWAHLGWDPVPGEPRRTPTARARVLAALALSGCDEALRQEACARFSRFVASHESLSPDLVGVTARIVVASGGEEAWSRVLSLYKAARTPQDKMRYMVALSDISDEEIRARTLDLALSRDVRTQDATFLVGLVLGQRGAARSSWEWVERHWEVLESRFASGLLARIFDAIPAVVEADLAESVHAFCDTHEIPMAGPRVNQLLERMDINVALAGRIRGLYPKLIPG
jgi:puromycin-sensitive aminopeptidase